MVIAKLRCRTWEEVDQFRSVISDSENKRLDGSGKGRPSIDSQLCFRPCFPAFLGLSSIVVKVKKKPPPPTRINRTWSESSLCRNSNFQDFFGGLVILWGSQMRVSQTTVWSCPVYINHCSFLFLWFFWMITPTIINMEAIGYLYLRSLTTYLPSP